MQAQHVVPCESGFFFQKKYMLTIAQEDSQCDLRQANKKNSSRLTFCGLVDRNVDYPEPSHSRRLHSPPHSTLSHHR
jgi:hypothetical protein